jgi:hypothetical protein
MSARLAHELSGHLKAYEGRKRELEASLTVRLEHSDRSQYRRIRGKYGAFECEAVCGGCSSSSSSGMAGGGSSSVPVASEIPHALRALDRAAEAAQRDNEAAALQRNPWFCKLLDQLRVYMCGK